jgi:hypothetical protein
MKPIKLLIALAVLAASMLLLRAQQVPQPEQAFICTICGTNSPVRILFSTNMVNWTVVAQIHCTGPWAISVTETNVQGFFMCDTNATL